MEATRPEKHTNVRVLFRTALLNVVWLAIRNCTVYERGAHGEGVDGRKQYSTCPCCSLLGCVAHLVRRILYRENGGCTTLDRPTALRFAASFQVEELGLPVASKRALSIRSSRDSDG